jgi:hypothetical protein
VHIERREVGGKLTIDYFSKDDLRTIFELLNKQQTAVPSVAAEQISAATPLQVAETAEMPAMPENDVSVDDRTPMEQKEEENEDIYSVSNFSI